MTWFGVDVNRSASTSPVADIYQADAATYGGNGLGPHCKFFASANGDWAEALAHMQVMGWGQHPNERVPVLCADVHTNSSLDAVITYFGRRKLRWCAVFTHEVQAPIMYGQLSVRKFRHTLDAMAARRKSHLRYGKYMRIVGCNSGYWLFQYPKQVRSKGCDVLNLYRGTPVDIVSVDHYWVRTESRGPGYLRTYLAEFDRFAADARRLGVPWAATEMGLGVHLGSARPTLLHHAVVHLRKSGALWAAYWEGVGRGDYRLRGHPEALAVWKAAIAAGR